MNEHVNSAGTLVRGKHFPFAVDISARPYLFFIALVVQLVASAVSGVGFSLNSGGYWIIGVLLWALWFVLMFIIISPRSNLTFQNHITGVRRAATTIFVSLAILGLLEIFAITVISPMFERNGTKGDFATLLEQLRHGFQYNDGTALGQQATENLLAGKNPYANSNIVTAMIKYDGSYDRVTPLRIGSLKNVFPYPTEEQLTALWDKALLDPQHPPAEIESRVCYPAGSFLLPAPFIAAGITDIRIVYVIFVIAGLAYAVWKIPSKKRLLFVAFAVVSLELWNSLADGETGSIVFPLLLIAWVSLGKNNWLSAIMMGLAVTTKQTAWFFLPFYLILLWRTSGLKTLGTAISMIAGIFFVSNAYFIFLDPSLWITSVTSPMTEPMFPLGVGTAAAVLGGVLNVKSALPFLITEGAVGIICLVWYFRNCRRYAYAGPVIAVLPLFFAWRSLWSYFFYVALITLACILTESSKEKPMASADARG